MGMQREKSRISVPADGEQASIVRQFVRLACHRYECDDAADSILQVTDVLVTNVVDHAVAQGGPDRAARVDVGISPTSQGVRIEVHDDTPSADGTPFSGDDGPMGLRIVSTLAASWGVDAVPDGTVVWAEIGGPALMRRRAAAERG